MLTNGNLVMMDVAACKEASAQIIVGQNTTGLLDGTPFDWLVIDKTEFSVKLQGPTNRLTVPIEYTNAYKRIIEMRVPVATNDGTPAKRGRPAKATSAAPVEQPGIPPANPFLPPGYTGPSMGSMAVQTPGVGAFKVGPPTTAPVAQPMSTAPVQAPALPVREMTIQEATEGGDWPEKSFDEAIANLQEHFMVILEGVRKEAAEITQDRVAASQVAVAPRRLTCFDCVYFDNAGWLCSKFNAVPPLHVVATAVASCSEFIEAGISEEEIPY